MNKELFRYKTAFVTWVLVISYAYMHVRLTGIYIDTDLEKLMNLSARLPFGQRMLVPALANGLHRILPWSPEEIFFLLELFFVSLLFFTLKRLFQFAFNKNQSELFSWFFLLLLPLMSVVNYRFTTQGEATFFYPYDSACLFFMALGFLLCLQKRWVAFTLVVLVATFNRESSVLLVLLIPALHSQERRGMLKPLAAAALAYAFARLMILFLVRHLPGAWTEWYFLSFAETHFHSNLIWLFNQQHLLLFMFCFAGLPLFWFAFYDYIPRRYRPLRYVAFFYFTALLFIGNFIEARVFQEILMLLYLPVCIAISRWVSGQEPDWQAPLGPLDYLNRYAIFIMMAGLLLLRHPLQALAVRLSA
ncbi:hypothetical protein [Legionella taurinensis]|uniref:EpsG family protein n=1 Tax=Legionella taurinensis TaxID=70611 RepID=A0A3A5L315_9GAMM|nr:hypothetical protein [Legionella taurinensis]RJT45948.1 hypothetical protein D6J04_10150 [Legionella taurinensis]RJT66445.1 hypothetical protein D6J03_10790 [Legionella taurinensis]STY27423.1 Uncharacterised protein [Legionella taurinensis]